MKKIMELKEALNLVKDGDRLAFGGNVLHRAPMAFIRELVRQKKRNLKIIKTAAAHDIDLLCAGGCVETVDAGFVSYETEYGLATNYRKAVEAGAVKANEHACYTVIAALRGAVAGVPFMPVYGLKEGDLLKHNDYFRVIEDPFGGGPITVVKTLTPDIGVIHVQECDESGNARIFGPKFEDLLISRASKQLIITTEKIVPNSRMRMQPETVDIPGFLVAAVVHTPRGAAPCSCDKMYEIDSNVLTSFINMKTIEEIEEYLKQYEIKDHSGSKRGGGL